MKSQLIKDCRIKVALKKSSDLLDIVDFIKIITPYRTWPIISKEIELEEILNLYTLYVIYHQEHQRNIKFLEQMMANLKL